MDQSTPSQPTTSQPEPMNIVPPVIPAQAPQVSAPNPNPAQSQPAEPPAPVVPVDSSVASQADTGIEHKDAEVATSVDTSPVSTSAAVQPVQPSVSSDAATHISTESLTEATKAEAGAATDTVSEPVISLQSDIPTPPNAMSGPLKEFGPPIAAPAPEAPAEVVTPTDAEPDLPQEVKEAGVEATPNTDQPNVPKQIQQATGITPVNDAVPVPVAPTMDIDLPMPEAEATQVIKTRKVSESIRWLATQILEQAKRAHGQLTGKK